MINYKPVPFKTRLGQALMPSSPDAVLPPSPDVLYTGYTGIPGVLETLLVGIATGTAAWASYQTVQREKNKYLKGVAWAGVAGSALLLLLYVAGKTGLNQMVGLPAVRVTPD